MKIITKSYKTTRLIARNFQWFSTSFRRWFIFSMFLYICVTEKINFIHIHTHKYTLQFWFIKKQQENRRKSMNILNMLPDVKICLHWFKGYTETKQNSYITIIYQSAFLTSLMFKECHSFYKTGLSNSQHAGHMQPSRKICVGCESILPFPEICIHAFLLCKKVVSLVKKTLWKVLTKYSM